MKTFLSVFLAIIAAVIAVNWYHDEQRQFDEWNHKLSRLQYEAKLLRAGARESDCGLLIADAEYIIQLLTHRPFFASADPQLLAETQAQLGWARKMKQE